MNSSCTCAIYSTYNQSSNHSRHSQQDGCLLENSRFTYVLIILLILTILIVLF